MTEKWNKLVNWIRATIYISAIIAAIVHTMSGCSKLKANDALWPPDLIPHIILPEPEEKDEVEMA
jgi:hypothetical protein